MRNALVLLLIASTLYFMSGAPHAQAASVAFDNAFNNGATSNNTLGSYTVTDATGHGLLIVWLVGDIASDCATGITYNAVAMTQVQKFHAGAAISITDRWVYEYALGNLSTQTGNIVETGCTFSNLKAQSYSGAFATLDNFNEQEHAPGSNFTSSTFQITPNASGSWALLFTYWEPSTAGTGATLRATSSGSQTMFDSNGSVTAGSPYSMTVTTPSDNYLLAFQTTIAPAKSQLSFWQLLPW